MALRYLSLLYFLAYIAAQSLQPAPCSDPSQVEINVAGESTKYCMSNNHADQNCLTYTGLICTECMAGYFYNPKQVKCQKIPRQKHCQDCYHGENSCRKCQPGYVPLLDEGHGHSFCVRRSHPFGNDKPIFYFDATLQKYKCVYLLNEKLVSRNCDEMYMNSVRVFRKENACRPENVMCKRNFQYVCNECICMDGFTGENCDIAFNTFVAVPKIDYSLSHYLVDSKSKYVGYKSNADKKYLVLEAEDEPNFEKLTLDGADCVLVQEDGALFVASGEYSRYGCIKLSS